MDAITPGAEVRRTSAGSGNPNGNPSGDWTDERVEILKREWETGASCSQIATVLGGVTRCAVIGKIDRLGLTRATGYVQPKRHRVGLPKSTRADRLVRRKKLTAVLAESPEKIAAPVTLDPKHRKTIFQLENCHCRFPLWADAAPAEEQFFCGSPTASLIRRQPYCQAHAEIAGRMYGAAA